MPIFICPATFQQISKLQSIKILKPSVVLLASESTSAEFLVMTSYQAGHVAITPEGHTSSYTDLVPESNTF